MSTEAVPTKRRSSVVLPIIGGAVIALVTAALFWLVERYLF